MRKIKKNDFANVFGDNIIYQLLQNHRTFDRDKILNVYVQTTRGNLNNYLTKNICLWTVFNVIGNF